MQRIDHPVPADERPDPGWIGLAAAVVLALAVAQSVAVGSDGVTTRRDFRIRSSYRARH